MIKTSIFLPFIKLIFFLSNMPKIKNGSIHNNWYSCKYLIDADKIINDDITNTIMKRILFDLPKVKKKYTIKLHIIKEGINQRSIFMLYM
jgi:hypothetical protein